MKQAMHAASELVRSRNLKPADKHILKHPASFLQTHTPMSKMCATFLLARSLVSFPSF